jgi:hypothetical protein
MSVMVRDNVAVHMVFAVLIKPESQKSPVHLNRVSGNSQDGESPISSVVSMNTGSYPLVYGVKVRALDTSNISSRLINKRDRLLSIYFAYALFHSCTKTVPNFANMRQRG